MTGAASAPRRPLVRVPNWIGDIVMATPALRALAAAWSDAELTVAGPPHAGPILDGLPYVGRFVALSPPGAAGLARVRSDAARLAAGGHELCVLMTHSFSSALAAWWARIPRRFGYAAGWRAPLLTESLRAPRERGRHRRPVPMVEHYARLVEALGAPRGSHRTELAVPEAVQAAADAWLARHGLDDGAPIFGFHGGSSFGPSKLWYPERFARVADVLCERHGARSLVLCGPGEQDLVAQIRAHARGPMVTADVDPIDLSVLKGVVRRLSLLVTTDTGPRHFGPALGVPTICLMGSTDPVFTNTNLHGSRVVRVGVECSPCQLKECPIDHRCMTRLTPEMVLAAAELELARAGPAV